ncbi:unnamed protein product, partial [Urochloa humidicola]
SSSQISAAAHTPAKTLPRSPFQIAAACSAHPTHASAAPKISPGLSLPACSTTHPNLVCACHQPSSISPAPVTNLACTNIEKVCPPNHKSCASLYLARWTARPPFRYGASIEPDIEEELLPAAPSRQPPSSLCGELRHGALARLPEDLLFRPPTRVPEDQPH